MKRISIIFGTRPEAIKLAPVVRAIRAEAELKPHVCVTAQHRDMLDQVLSVFDIQPDVDLDLMRQNQSLAALTSSLIAGIDSYLSEFCPDFVLVQGDTTTTFCAGLCAHYRRVPLGHIEAGLRTGHKYAPFPEEMNRVMTSRLADYHFAATKLSRDNLVAEGVCPDSIFVTGNTVVDALQIAVEAVRKAPPIVPGLPRETLEERRLVLITGHRRESFGAGMDAISKAIAKLATEFPDVNFVYPLHPNPNVSGVVRPRLAGFPNVFLIAPQEYLAFVYLMYKATVVLTDSGGVQEEAPALGKRVLVMRTVTERPEAVEAGAAVLIGTEETGIVQTVSRILRDHKGGSVVPISPFGDGLASQRILAVCREVLAPKQGARLD